MRKFYRLIAVLCLGLLPALPAFANGGYITARAHAYTHRLQAYASVQPISLVRLRSRHNGRLVHFSVVPGQRVQANQVLGRLGGPEIKAGLANARAGVAAYRALLKAAQQVLKVDRNQLTLNLITRKALYQSEASVQKIKARLSSARTRLKAFERTTHLITPVAGTVTAVDASEGDQIKTGQTLLSLQAPGRLWLRARFYGQASQDIHAGMTGVFTPSDGRQPVKVKTVSILPAVASDGAQPVGLEALKGQPGWLSGEAGTVSLKGKSITAVSVPTRALVLDQGRWWVLVHTPKGNHRRAVRPGPSRGDFTLLTRGLKPGEQVVVDNAYIDFHSHFSAHYKPPD